MGQKKHKANKDAPVREPALIYGTEAAGEGWLGPEETVRHIRAGLPMAEFDGLAELLDLPAERLADYLAITRSTLARRRKNGRLGSLESDRLLRYARVFARAETVLEGRDAAREWLKTPARALGHATPLDFARTEAGVREVENLLGRLDYGVFN
mgnify:CR=1 FL=1